MSETKFQGSSPQIAVVTGIDTKNKGARAKFKGAKIVTESIWQLAH